MVFSAFQWSMRLPTGLEPKDTSQPKSKKFAVPKITRLKLCGIIFVVIFVSITIAVSCIKSSYLEQTPICNLSKNGTRLPQGVAEDSVSHMKFKHMKKRLPQCIIIGVRKAGTRALLKYLNIHPDVVAKGAEMHFFDDDEFYTKSLEAYRKEMPPSFEGQLTVEKTPGYFTEPLVPERMYRMNSSIRLLLILREPVERLVSDYLQFAEGKITQGKPCETFNEKVFDKYGNINKSYKGVSRSVYHKHLKRWTEDLFTMKQFLIIESSELVQDPPAVMAKVEDFLGLRHYIKPRHFYFNKTKGFHCIKSGGGQECLADSKGREHPDLKPN
ncbi:HS3S1-like protein, partial [Mya arenaria]